MTCCAGSTRRRRWCPSSGWRSPRNAGSRRPSAATSSREDDEKRKLATDRRGVRGGVGVGMSSHTGAGDDDRERRRVGAALRGLRGEQPDAALDRSWRPDADVRRARTRCPRCGDGSTCFQSPSERGTSCPWVAAANVAPSCTRTLVCRPEPYATPTLWAAAQYLGPKEVAPAHRHSQSAFRFVLEGEGVWTVVDGDPVAMRRGDLLLTAGWRWHEHHNVADAPMVWLDGLDIPLVSGIDAGFFEFGPEELSDRSTPQTLLAASACGHIPACGRCPPALQRLRRSWPTGGSTPTPPSPRSSSSTPKAGPACSRPGTPR